MRQSISFWEHDSFLKPFDVLIIGAGIVGLSAAYFLKQKHPSMRIGILERGLLPSGASTKNAGFACFGSPTELLADAENESEVDVLNRIQWRWNGIQLLLKTLGTDAIQYNACGGFELFNQKETYDEVLSKLPLLNDWMSESTGVNSVFSPSSVQENPAVSISIEGSIHPGLMMQEWIRLNQHVGNMLWFNTKVSRVETGLVELENGFTLKTSYVLVASNGFAAQLLPVAIKPARGLVLLTNSLKNMPWKGVFHYNKGYVYFRNVGDRLLLGGGRDLDFSTEETNEFGENPLIVDYLTSLSKSLLGIDIESELAFKWSGIMGFSESKSPIMTEIKPNVLIRAGLGGMGVAIGSAIGKDVADTLTG